MNSNKALYPSLAQSWWLCTVFIVFTLIFSLGASAIVGEETSTWQMPIVFVLIFTFTFLFAHYFIRKSGDDFSFLICTPINWRLLPLLFVFVISLGIVIEALGGLIPMPESIRKTFEELTSFSLPMIIVSCILAPILEEFLCRGIILRGLLSRMTPTRAILFSALLFAILHLNPWQGIAGILLGTLLGYVYWRTQSLLLCIYIHFVNNVLGVTGSYYFPGVASIGELFGNYYWGILLLCVLMVLACSYFFKRLTSIQLQKDNN